MPISHGSVTVVSVHKKPHLLAVQAASLINQEGVTVDHVVVDTSDEGLENLPPLGPPRTLVKHANEKKHLEHGSALDAVMEMISRNELPTSRRLVIMDSDCFLSSLSSLKTIVTEVVEHGCSGDETHHHGAPAIAAHLIASTPSKIMAAWSLAEGFTPRTWECKWSSRRSYWDTGSLVGIALRPPGFRRTQAEFIHGWSLTRMAFDPTITEHEEKMWPNEYLDFWSSVESAGLTWALEASGLELQPYRKWRSC